MGPFFFDSRSHTMRKIFSTMSFKWLPGVEEVTIKARTVTVVGPRGTLTRSFKSVSADIYGDVAAKKISVDMWFGTSKQTAVLRTVCTHIKYKMKFVYAHFPVNVNISDAKDVIEIRNFLGEKVIRRIEMLEGVTVDRSEVKDEIILESNNVENLGTSASQIQQCTRVKNKDIRKFLDGIYVSEKGLIVQDD